jgi:hypothetical protein
VQGTPEVVARNKKSHTGRFLAEAFARDEALAAEAHAV